MSSAIFVRLALVSTLLVVACGGTAPVQISQPKADDRGDAASRVHSRPDSSAILPQPVPTAPTAAPAAIPAVNTQPDLSEVGFSTGGWKTDFARHSVLLTEITPGGPPRDGIPPIDDPRFVSVEEAGSWLKPWEPVIHLSVGGEARAYPLQILIWHEIVNDTLGGVPVAVTFCPLCNTAIAFDRRVGNRTLDFGTTGNLRKSDLVMWDRQTESWWQQVTGEAIVGELTGHNLRVLPATIVGWQEFRAGFPEGRVLSRETGFSRAYGTNPYVGYDDVNSPPFLYESQTDGRLPPKERVVTVSLGGEDVAYPFSVLRERRVIADMVGGEQIVVFYVPGTNSALDKSSIGESRDVGSAAVYSPWVDGSELSFHWRNGAFLDDQTGTRWMILGMAEAGPLDGKQLEPVAHANHFWFAWAAFEPNTRIYSARSAGGDESETSLFPAAALGPLPPAPPPLPFADGQDPGPSGTPTAWGGDRPAWATGIYGGRMLGLAVYLYDSPRRTRVVGQVLHRSRIQILQHLEGAPGYYFVRSLEMDPVQEGWLPAPLATFERPPGLSLPACAGKLCVHPPRAT